MSPADAEQYILNHVRAMATVAAMTWKPGWPGCRYRHLSELLLDVGRLFTAAPPPATVGTRGKCWSNASRLAEERSDVVYVEGLAADPWDARFGGLPHAWCAVGDQAIDPSPGWAGAVYVGVPLTDAYRREMLLRYGPGPYLFGELVVDESVLIHGMPDGAVADIGRPLPTPSNLFTPDG